MDTRKFTVVNEVTVGTPNGSFTVPFDPTEINLPSTETWPKTAAFTNELVKRWNAHPELETALADLHATASEVQHMMDGDKDKQEAWAEELSRLYIAVDAAKVVLASLTQ